ncbi:pyruvate kinase, partial [Butyrivibrio sp. AE3004]|uniref:pyruvate kinase n=1 Tax=Butyrivibrio sp. AE3004 TaxID=1506994 RepID=UPI000494CE26
MTDIFGTIGPACSNEETIRKMFESGMTGVRFNLSHSMLEDNEKLIETVRRLGKQAGIVPKILIDLQGPELRIGSFEKEKMLSEGDIVTFGEDEIPLSGNILCALGKDMEILLDDGKILCHVVENDGKAAKAKVDRGGLLKSRKSIAIKDIDIEMNTLTDSDMQNIKCAINNGITGIMQPFVRERRDVITLKDILKKEKASNIEVYSKIENQRGLEKLDEIILECDELIIARGDLGNVVPLWELPGIQKRIAKRCSNSKKRFMVVTQMLSSMENNPVPTRAEVSDIFNAILDGASSVMVTGETAVGKYPDKVISYLKRTVECAEKFQRNI